MINTYMWNQTNKKSKLLETEHGKVVTRSWAGAVGVVGGLVYRGNTERLVRGYKLSIYMMNKVLASNIK